MIDYIGLNNLIYFMLALIFLTLYLLGGFSINVTKDIDELQKKCREMETKEQKKETEV